MLSAPTRIGSRLRRLLAGIRKPRKDRPADRATPAPPGASAPKPEVFVTGRFPLPALDPPGGSAVTEPSTHYTDLLLAALERHGVPFKQHAEDGRFIIVHDALVRTDTLTVCQTSCHPVEGYSFRDLYYPIVRPGTELGFAIEVWVVMSALQQAGVMSGTASYGQPVGWKPDQFWLDHLLKKWAAVRSRQGEVGAG